MKDRGVSCRVGQIIEISPSKVPRVIGKSGSMIQMIKGYTNCRIFVGQNGRIWLDGEVDSIMHAIKAIQMIEQDAHSYGLTEKVKAYLEAEAHQSAPSSE